MPVKHLIAAALNGTGAPTSVEAQFIGQIYLDLATQDVYIPISKTAGDFIKKGSFI